MLPVPMVATLTPRKRWRAPLKTFSMVEMVFQVEVPTVRHTNTGVLSPTTSDGSDQ